MEKFYEKFNDFMKKETRGVHIGLYTATSFGLIFAIRKIRPFSKFKTPTDIPKHFYAQKIELKGIVRRISADGSILLVEHKPLVKLLPFSVNSACLPVRLAGAKVTNLGLSWLQTIVAGKDVVFRPLSGQQDFVHCEVLMPELVKDKLGRSVKNANLAEELIKIGFASFDPQLADLMSVQYRAKLRAAEAVRQRKLLGYRYYMNPALQRAEGTLLKLWKYLKEKTALKPPALKQPSLATV